MEDDGNEPELLIFFFNNIVSIDFFSRCADRLSRPPLIFAILDLQYLYLTLSDIPFLSMPLFSCLALFPASLSSSLDMLHVYWCLLMQKLDSPAATSCTNKLHHTSNRTTATHQAVHSLGSLCSIINIIKLRSKCPIPKNPPKAPAKSHRGQGFSYPIRLRSGETYTFLFLGIHGRLGRRSMNRSSRLACRCDVTVGSRFDTCRMRFREIDECFLGLGIWCGV